MQPIKLIKFALDSTVSLINKGEGPTAALEKVARELDLNQNFIQRVGENLNTALFYRHFQKTAGDKSGSYAIANIEGVVKSIFGEKEQSKTQKKANWFPKTAEDINYNKLLKPKKLTKTAAEDKLINLEKDDMEFKRSYHKAANYILQLERELDDLKTEKVGHETYLEAAVHSLIKDFTKDAGYRPEFHSFETSAYAVHGKRAVPYLDLIYKEANLKEDRGEYIDQLLSYENSKQLKTFTSMLKAASALIDIRKELAEGEQFVEEQKTKLKEASYILNPEYRAFVKEACSELADTLLSKIADGRGASLLQDLLDQFSDAAMHKGAKKPVFKNTESDNRERIAILQDLLMTDPILHKADPYKVISAYEQMLRLAPHMSKQKEVVRAQLRGMLAVPAFAAHDANQLVEANTNLMKQHQLLNAEESGTGAPGKGGK